ncbi:MAG: AAA family ATPase [Nitriliruptoraceae bacterium]
MKLNRSGSAMSGFELPRVLAVMNQKGGVGKTTTTVSVAAALAARGVRVLIVDLDPQGNASVGLGIRIRETEVAVYDVLLADVSLNEAIRNTAYAQLDVAPSSIDLAGAEVELVSVGAREQRLRDALRTVAGMYDVVLIDCPPSLGLLTVNALVAADNVIVPIQCEYYALEGLRQLLTTVGRVTQSLNPELELGGVVLTMYDGRTNLAQNVVDEVREHFGEQVFASVIPRSVRLAEAPSYGEPIRVFDPESRGASAYEALADEFCQRFGFRCTPPTDILGMSEGHQ